MTKKEIQKLIKIKVLKQLKDGYKTTIKISFKPEISLLEDLSLNEFFTFLKRILIESVETHVEDTKNKLENYGKTKKAK